MCPKKTTLVTLGFLPSSSLALVNCTHAFTALMIAPLTPVNSTCPPTTALVAAPFGAPAFAPVRSVNLFLVGPANASDAHGVAVLGVGTQPYPARPTPTLNIRRMEVF
eukprot:9141674-Pyramimonas_sp.AAC.1